MSRLPDKAAGNETIHPWNVREATLHLGALAARDLGRWESARQLSAQVLDSQRRRGASALDIASYRLSEYGPLLSTGTPR